MVFYQPAVFAWASSLLDTCKGISSESWVIGKCFVYRLTLLLHLHQPLCKQTLWLAPGQRGWSVLMDRPCFPVFQTRYHFSRLQLYRNEPLISAQYFYSRKSLNKILLVTPFALPSFFFVCLFPCFLFPMDFHSKKGQNEGQVSSCCSVSFVECTRCFYCCFHS